MLFTSILISCEDKKPQILHAFSDSFAASWELKLYQDRTFYLYLPVSDNSGKYHINGDTIHLEYTENKQGVWPRQFLIDTLRRTVTSPDSQQIIIELQEYTKNKTHRP